MRLFLANERRIRGFILTLVPSWSDASDLLQETATTLWEKFAEFESSGDENRDFVAWALKVARYLVLNFRRKEKRSALRFSDACLELLADEASIIARDGGERIEALRRCVASLGAEDREVLRLRYQPDATTRSVAGHLGRTTNAVYKLLNRLHRQLLYCVRGTLESDLREESTS